jgi:hypothetical protein
MPGPGSKRMKPYGLVAEDGQLVDERDVDRPEDVLEQLGQLGSLEARDLHDVVADLCVQGDRSLHAHRREGSEDLGGVAHRVVGAAGVDTLGGEGHVKVAAGGEPRFLEQGDEALAGGARVRGRLEHDELFPLEDVGQGRPRRDQRAEIRLAVAGERRGHGDDHGLDRGQLRVARRGPELSREAGDPLRGDVLDVALARLDRGDSARIRVDPHHLVTLVAEGRREREAHVAEPDYPDLHDRGV